MSSTNPLLLGLNQVLDFQSLTAEHIGEATHKSIELAKAELAKLYVIPAQNRTFDNTLLAYDKMESDFSKVYGYIYLLANSSTQEDVYKECHQNIEVLGPDINESGSKFAVNKKGQIRFGLQAIKGAGDAAVQALINERNKNGDFKSIFDLVERLSLNKKTFEALVLAGGFDCFTTIHRSQYFNQNGTESNIEKIIKYSKVIRIILNR